MLIRTKGIINLFSTGPLVHIAIIIFIAFLLYGRTLNFGFASDDYHQDRHYSLKEILSAFWGTWEPRHIEPIFYRPLVVASFAANYFIFRTHPLGYHLTNLVINAVNAVLVYWIMVKLGARAVFGLVAGMLFLLIPYNAIVVSWISHRSDIIATMFYLASFIAFIKFYNFRDKVFWYIFSVLCFIFSLMSKETAATLPFIILSYSFLQSKRWNIKLAMPYLMILCSYLIFRVIILKGMGGYTLRGNFLEAILKNWCLAAIRTVIPFSYVDFYPLLIYLTLFSALVLFGAVSFKSFRNKDGIFFALSWVGLTILPLYTLSLSRQLYLSSIGLAMLLSWLGAELYAKKAGYAVTLILLLCAILLPVNIVQQDFFKPDSPYVIYRNAVLYTTHYSRLDKEQLSLLVQELEKYGLKDKDSMQKEGVISRPDFVKMETSPHLRKFKENSGLIKLLKKILPEFI